MHEPSVTNALTIWLVIYEKEKMRQKRENARGKKLKHVLG